MNDWFGKAVENVEILMKRYDQLLLANKRLVEALELFRDNKEDLFNWDATSGRKEVSLKILDALAENQKMMGIDSPQEERWSFEVTSTSLAED